MGDQIKQVAFSIPLATIPLAREKATE